jgi:hypothetical protein
MDTYLIRRRNAWKDGAELEKTAAVSRRIGDEEMSDSIRWISKWDQAFAT